MSLSRIAAIAGIALQEQEVDEVEEQARIIIYHRDKMYDLTRPESGRDRREVRATPQSGDVRGIIA